MPGRHKQLNQRQFGAHAQNFVVSPTHAKGRSLQRLVALICPQPTWCVLDVATGGGHTALAFAAHAARVVASDLTYPMLLTARDYVRQGGARNIVFCQAEAESLPFAPSTFDCVTCRIAPHHFADVTRFVQEATRILKPGGVLGVADNVTSGEPKIAQFANTLDKLRDPSHQWAYSVEDWETFYFLAGLQVTHREVFRKETDFDEWAARVGVTGDDLTRLRALLAQVPREAREWFALRSVGQRLVFDITEAIFIGVKPA